MKQDNPFQPTTSESPKSDGGADFGQSSSLPRDNSKGYTSGAEPIAVKDTRASQGAFGDAKGIAKESIQDVKEGAKEITGSAKEALSRAKDVAGGSKGAQIGQDVAGGTKEVTKAVKSAAAHLRDGAADIMEDVGSGAKEVSQSARAAAGDAKDTGQKVLQDATEGAKGLAHVAAEVASDATEAIHEAKGGAQGMLRHAKEAVVESVQRAGPKLKRANRATGAFVSSNAVPISLVGFGAGWLLMSGRQRPRTTSRTNGAPESQPRQLSSAAADNTGSGIAEIKETIGEVKETIGNITEKANERAQETAHVVRERVVDYAHRAVHQAENIRDAAGERAAKLKREASAKSERVKAATARMAKGNPLLLVALSLGAGIGTAMLFPATKREDRLMGDARDRLVGEARDAAAGVGKVARKAAGDLRDNLAH